jgi:hypothetical protein
MGKIVKIILGFIVLAAILGAGLYFLAGSKKNTTAEPLSSQTGVTENAGATNSQTVDSDQFLGLLLSISSIALDDSLFMTSSFRSLRDFSTTLTKDTTNGRPNPFAPLGQDAALDTGASSYTVTTMQPAQITSTTAVLSATLPRGLVPAERWFEWGTEDTEPFQNQTPKVQQNLNTGTYGFTLSNLTPNTVYYVRAAARVGTTQFFGTVVPFQTPRQ